LAKIQREAGRPKKDEVEGELAQDFSTASFGMKLPWAEKMLSNPLGWG
jgi:hypothetical protein